MNDPDPQVAISSHSSPSVVSEPPDIRNWFSSYTYQSPVLGTNELYGDSRGIDEEERVLFVEDSENEEEEDCEDLTRGRKSHQSGICDRTTPPIIRKPVVGNRDHDHHLSPLKAPAYTDTLSLPSEPPDIRNWFSSYVYESPTLDSADFDISLLSNNDFGNIQEPDKAEEKTLKETEVKGERHFCNEISLDGFALSARSVGVDNDKSHSDSQKDGSEKVALHSNKILCPNRASDQGTQGATLKSISVIPDKSTEALRVRAQGSLPILRANHSTSPANAPCSLKKTEEGEMKAEKEPIVSENDFGWILPNPKSRKPDFKSIKKKDGQCLFTQNGYSSLNKKINATINDENSSRQLGHSKCNYDSNVGWVPSSCKVKDRAVEREALKETTNFLHSCKMEVAGKWRCPQKSKPDKGPPLKQLRLEKWVHRL